MEDNKTVEEILSSLTGALEDSDEMKAMATMLELPDEQFKVIAPSVLEEFERSINNSNDIMLIVQSMNLTGAKVEDMQETAAVLSEQIDQLEEYSALKKDFLKRMINSLLNAVNSVEGVSKRFIRVPIEYCAEGAKMPEYAHLTDSGMDVFAIEDIEIAPGETVLVHTGLKVAIPNGYELQVRPKSGRSLKSKLRICNTPGTIDAGYRDEICIICENVDAPIKALITTEEGIVCGAKYGSPIHIDKGEKIAQLVLMEVPKAVFYEVADISALGENRGGGFGSTGDK